MKNKNPIDKVKQDQKEEIENQNIGDTLPVDDLINYEEEFNTMVKELERTNSLLEDGVDGYTTLLAEEEKNNNMLEAYNKGEDISSVDVVVSQEAILNTLTNLGYSIPDRINIEDAISSPIATINHNLETIKDFLDNIKGNIVKAYEYIVKKIKELFNYLSSKQTTAVYKDISKINSDDETFKRIARTISFTNPDSDPETGVITNKGVTLSNYQDVLDLKKLDVSLNNLEKTVKDIYLFLEDTIGKGVEKVGALGIGEIIEETTKTNGGLLYSRTNKKYVEKINNLSLFPILSKYIPNDNTLRMMVLNTSDNSIESTEIRMKLKEYLVLLGGYRLCNFSFITYKSYLTELKKLLESDVRIKAINGHLDKIGSFVNRVTKDTDKKDTYYGELKTLIKFNKMLLLSVGEVNKLHEANKIIVNELNRANLK